VRDAARSDGPVLRLLWIEDGRRVTDPRTRRLEVEHEALRAEFSAHDLVSVEPLGWHPADRYRVTYSVRGVALDAAGQPAVADRHVAVFSAGASYPREPPEVVVESPLFHPNVGPAVGDPVDLLDGWTARLTLADAIAHVGDLIQYRRYDVDTPRNLVAARWAAENPSVFPLGQAMLRHERSREQETPVGDGAESSAGSPALDEPPAVDPDSIWAPKPTGSEHVAGEGGA
jgi:hypothetical protein